MCQINAVSFPSVCDPSYLQEEKSAEFTLETQWLVLQDTLQSAAECPAPCTRAPPILIFSEVPTGSGPSISCTFIPGIPPPCRKAQLTPILQMNPKTGKIHTCWILPKFWDYFKWMQAGAATERVSSASLPCPYIGCRAHKPCAEGDPLHICPDKPQICSLPPPPG